MTDHTGDTFTVQTIEERHEFEEATTYRAVPNPDLPNFLQVLKNDSTEDGETKLRVFQLDHVIDYGWE